VAREQRKLAAILAADVVGYSRLMGRDESGTVARLRGLRGGRLEPLLVRHGGRLVKLAGDGALIEFTSAVDALSAAIEFQQATADANHAQPEDTAIVFRMGLHLGDVIVEGDDLYGDAVNVAYRLEAEAQSGGIVVSDAVRDAVGGRLKATFVDRGSLTLKNIERPIHAFGVNWEPSDWPVLLTPAGRASRARRMLWTAAAVSVVILAVVGYRIYAPQPAATMVELKDLKADDLEHLLVERRTADAAMAEKKRLEEEARARAEAESATAQQAEAALKTRDSPAPRNDPASQILTLATHLPSLAIAAQAHPRCGRNSGIAREENP
jgi:class 3 adenylate cyclase